MAFLERRQKFKIYGDVVREGIIKYAAGDTRAADGKPHWQKCRLVLAKVAGCSQHVLNFYSPPKVFFRLSLNY